MKLRYLVLPLALFQISSILGASAAATAPEANPKSGSAADVKGAAAETTPAPQGPTTTSEADAKTSLNPAFPFFEQWCKEHSCQPACPQDGECSPYCGCCLKHLKHKWPCEHMTSVAKRNFARNYSRTFEFARRFGLHDEPSTNHLQIHHPFSYAVTPLPEAAPAVVAAITVLPKALAPIIADYAFFQRIIYLTIRDNSAHPTSGWGSEHSCTYNLDTDVLTVHRNQYEYLDYSDKTIRLSDTPLSPGESPDTTYAK